jgi:large subunit ribosomal protein L5
MGVRCGYAAVAGRKFKGRDKVPCSTKIQEQHKMARLEEKYKSEIAPALKEKFGYKNLMQAPKLEKIVINMGLGEAIQNVKVLDFAIADLMKITGQRPLVTRARKSIANFKLRTGMAIGCKVTLRGRRMYEFLDRLLNVALPRIRDFKGVSPKSFDGRGNYALGLQEQIIFPEIDYDKIDKIRGMDVVIVTTAKDDEEAYDLLRQFGMPFRKQ